MYVLRSKPRLGPFSLMPASASIRFTIQGRDQLDWYHMEILATPQTVLLPDPIRI
jgi:hypothetical protein